MAITTVAALAAASPAAADPVPQKEKRARVAASASVTLITGDVVHVDTFADGRRRVTLLEPDGGPGRDALTYGSGKHLYVVPTEALAPLRTGRLDRRLFDVAALIEAGYGDATSPSIPLIVTGGGAPLTAQARQLSSVDGYAVAVDKRHTRDLWQSVSAESVAPRKIWLDGRVRVSLEQSVPQIGAPAAWQRGLDGTGTTVAVLDTGVDAGHPDLAGKVDAQQNFTAEPTANDQHGHGTHVAATVAGTGNGSAGLRKGVAPGARLISGRVLNQDGVGEESWVIAGMEWAAAAGADVVNLSLGGDPTDGNDLMSQAVNELTERTGTLFVIAAGNFGGRATIGSPGSATAALTVGNVTKSEELAGSSSRGPRLGDHAVKPEITAPGTDIVAARAAGTSAGNPVDELYTSLTGTSMATPHVAGAAAIVAQRHPEWRAAGLKSALAGSARPNPGLSVFEQGAGRVDVPAALVTAALATPQTLTFGFLKWPNQSQPPITRTLTYRNTGSTPLTLDLAVSTDQPVPDGAVTVAARELTVPAGGTAQTQVTVTPRLVDSEDLGGTVVATDRSTGTAVRTPLSLGVEPESYDLTVRAIGRDGKPAPGLVQLWRQGWEIAEYVGFEGEQVLRLPKGEYSAVGFVYSNEGPLITDLIVGGDPEVTLDRATTVTMDARAARDVSVRVPDQDAQVRSLLVTWSRAFSEQEFVESIYLFFQRRIPRLSVIASDPVRHGRFELATGWRLTAPELRLSAGHEQLAATPAFGSPRLTGRHRLPVVDAGAGGPDDFGKARGALALVAPSEELSPLQQAINGARAGARGVLLADPGLTGFSPAAWAAPIPVIALADVGPVAEAIRRGRPLSVDGPGHSPYVYNLMLPVQGALPANPSYTIRRGDVAAVTNTFHSVAPGRPTWESHHGWRPNSINDVGGVSDITEPISRVEYISPGDTRWLQTVQVPAPTLEAPVMYSGLQRYRPGERRERTWWQGPLTPTTGSENQMVIAGRDGDLIILGIDDYQDAEPDHWGQPYLLVGPDATTTARIFRDGRLISESHHAWGDYEVGPEPSTYRVEHTVDRTAPWWTTSTKSATTWTFRSAHTPSLQVLPIIDLDWSLRLGRQNDARELTVQTVRLRAGHVPGATAGPISRPQAWVSYDDGRKWHRVGLWRDGGSWSGLILNPPQGLTSGFVSLRATAVDADGNRVEQTIERAYRITRR